MNKDLAKLRKAKLLKIEKKVTVGEDGKQLPYLQVEKKRFDVDTGKEVEPEVQTLNPIALRQQLDQLKTAKTEVETQIANVEMLLKEFK